MSAAVQRRNWAAQSWEQDRPTSAGFPQAGQGNGLRVPFVDFGTSARQGWHTLLPGTEMPFRNHRSFPHLAHGIFGLFGMRESLP